MKGIGDSNPKGSTCCAFCIICDYIEDSEIELLAQSTEYGSDQKRRKKAKCHRTQCINEIGLDSNCDVFLLEEFFYAAVFHDKNLLLFEWCTHLTFVKAVVMYSTIK